jgi:hypothetical protein
MAISVQILKRTGLLPAGRARLVPITFDSSYPAGGEPFVPRDFELDRVDHIECEVAFGSSTTAYVVRADHANSKLQLYNSNGAAPAAFLETATANQSATVVRAMVYELPYS